MKSGMNQIQVPPFELILCQDVAMASRNPLECLLASKTSKKLKVCEKCFCALGPPSEALESPCAARQPLRALDTGQGSATAAYKQVVHVTCRFVDFHPRTPDDVQ